jgi:hypothetical protein
VAALEETRSQVKKHRDNALFLTVLVLNIGRS